MSSRPIRKRSTWSGKLRAGCLTARSNRLCGDVQSIVGKITFWVSIDILYLKFATDVNSFLIFLSFFSALRYHKGTFHHDGQWRSSDDNKIQRARGTGPRATIKNATLHRRAWALACHTRIRAGFPRHRSHNPTLAGDRPPRYGASGPKY